MALRKHERVCALWQICAVVCRTGLIYVGLLPALRYTSNVHL